MVHSELKARSSRGALLELRLAHLTAQESLRPQAFRADLSGIMEQTDPYLFVSFFNSVFGRKWGKRVRDSGAIGFGIGTRYAERVARLAVGPKYGVAARD